MKAVKTLSPVNIVSSSVPNISEAGITDMRTLLETAVTGGGF